jgi:hypothetical protein
VLDKQVHGFLFEWQLLVTERRLRPSGSKISKAPPGTLRGHQLKSSPSRRSVICRKAMAHLDNMPDSRADTGATVSKVPTPLCPSALSLKGEVTQAVTGLLHPLPRPLWRKKKGKRVLDSDI